MDLGRIDAAVLSHGHYDHAGGMIPLFCRNPQVKVHMRHGADGENCADHGKGMDYIGIPREVVRRYSHRFVKHTGTVELFPGVWLLPDGVADLEARSRRAGMYRRTEDGFVPEDFCHEQTLVLEGTQGLVVLNSCSHAGVADILSHVLNAFPGKRISAFVGGFHMMGKGGADTLGWSEEDVLAEGEALNALPVDVYYTCHCTGTPAFHLLQQVLGDRVRYFSTGQTIEVD